MSDVWYLGPGEASSPLDGLLEGIAGVHGLPSSIDALDTSDTLGAPSIVFDALTQNAAAATVRWLSTVDDQRALNIVAITSDGYLGTDLADPADSVMGAAVVAAVRAIAVSRNQVRANVVAIAEGLLGVVGEHRGPLAHVTGVADVVEAVLFLMNPENSYLSGQVLFVDSGRHLFSSHSS